MDNFVNLVNGEGGRVPMLQLTAFAQFMLIGIEFISPLLYAWVAFDSTVQKSTVRRAKNLFDQEYDFIVVGSGSAGAVVASRLSQNHQVLLIESGGKANPLQRIPILTYVLHNREPLDWRWRTVPQKNAGFGLNNNVVFWPSGKGLGGSSNINGMIFLRGNVQGFDIVANKSGNPKWSMKNLLKIYKGLEDYNGYFDDGFSHGKGGKLSIEKSHMHKVSQEFLRAGEELGYKIRDPNAYGPVTQGFAPMDFYLKRGRRWTSYHGYLQKIMKQRKSLTVLTYSTVTKVLIDSNKRAYGVELVSNGRNMIVKAKKEVILSAGSIQSAKLLMLSGIGPADHLEKIGIPVIKNLPVGNILQDKYGALVGPFISSPHTSFVRERDLNIKTLSQWAIQGNGPIACSRSEATWTLSSSFSKENDNGVELPDMHSYLLTWSVDGRYREELGNAFNFKEDLLENYFGKVKGLDSFLQMVTLNRVHGAGTLRLRDNDPFSMPIIDPKYLQDKKDLAVLVEAIRLAVKIVDETESFKKLNASLLPIPIPGCEKFKFKSDAYYECLAKTTTLTAYKYCGTAPIGKNENDPEAVVDSELRVFGIRGLRVVDASILQIRQVSVNHVTLQAVGELASQMILNYWSSHKSL